MMSGFEFAGTLGLGLFLLMVFGWLFWLAGHIWLIVQAFQDSIGWGIAVLLLPGLADLFYAIDHWVRARKPFLLSLLGGLMVVGAAAAPFVLVRYMGVKPEEAGEVPVEQVEPSLESEVARPHTDRERVADMLLNAGIDPSNPRTFQGKTIQQMTEALGAPSATLKTGREINYIFFNCFEVVSKDGGRTVADAHYMGK